MKKKAPTGPSINAILGVAVFVLLSAMLAAAMTLFGQSRCDSWVTTLVPERTCAGEVCTTTLVERESCADRE